MIWLLCSVLLAKPLDAHLMYFLLVDRFENGNKSNDGKVNLKDLQAFHGGDLQGVSNRMEHFEKMGVDAIWLSPIFEMRTEKFMGHGAFHGYWLNGMDRIEQKFGGFEALKTLSDKTKEKGISLIMDMVYNHVSFDSPMLEHHPDWFHPNLTIEDWNDPKQLTDRQVHGLPDLDQSREPVYRYLLHRSRYWRDNAQVQGFRIDAIRHMEDEFISRMVTDLKKDRAEIWLLGEDFQGNPLSIAERVKATGLDAIFDFPLYYSMKNVFCEDAPTSDLAATLWSDRNYPEDLQLVTFLDNHDLPRINSICGPSEFLKVLLFQFGVRGLPMITYGTEAGLKGEKEPENRRDMPWDSDGMIVEQIRTLRDLREKWPVLEIGKGQILELEKNWMVYQQSHKGLRSVLVVNNGDEKRELKQSGEILEGWMAFNELLEDKSRTVHANSTKLFVLGGKDTEEPSSDVEINFKVKWEGEQAVHIVGSAVEIGGWNPEKSLPLKKENDHWIGKVTLPSNAVVSWKLIRKDGDNYSWENGKNRILWKKRTIEVKIRE